MTSQETDSKSELTKKELSYLRDDWKRGLACWLKWDDIPDGKDELNYGIYQAIRRIQMYVLMIDPESPSTKRFTEQFLSYCYRLKIILRKLKDNDMAQKALDRIDDLNILLIRVLSGLEAPAYHTRFFDAIRLSKE
jgi:hypothetical protein